MEKNLMIDKLVHHSMNNIETYIAEFLDSEFGKFFSHGSKNQDLKRHVFFIRLIDLSTQNQSKILTSWAS
jgi:hypothetical protein